MDRDLLNALNNIGNQLDILSQILAEKNQLTSDVAMVLTSGDFSEQLKSISLEIKSIKSDTTQIIKNQQTILSMSKEKEKEKIAPIEESGSQNENLKKGVAVILGIAVAVIAIGTAFKLVGDVNIASVLSLSVAIGIIAFAFEKISKSDTLTIDNVLLASGLMVAMSIGILISSKILSKVTPISNENLLTTIGIAAAFSLVSLSIGKLISGLRGVKASDIIPVSIGMMFIFPALSVGIVLSSYVLRYVQPVGTAQILSSIMIAGLFVAISYAIKNIVSGLKDIEPDDAINTSFVAPILFIGLSFAIAGSSLAISMVQDITFSQFITSLGIAILFIGLSYVIKPILNATKGIKPSDIVTMPLLFTTLSIAIAVSSKILKDAEEIEFSKILKIVAFGVGLAIAVGALGLAARFLGNNLASIAKGSVAIVLLAGTIALSSVILNEGEYTKYPDVEWVKGVGFSIVAFGASALALGLLVVPLALQFGAGLIAVLGVAGAIVGVSKILKLGEYDVYPTLGWSLGVGASMLGFSVAIGALGLMVFGPQALIFAAGLLATLGVAKTIVSVSKILKDGEYSVGSDMMPWAKSTAMLYGAFAPIMVILGGVGLASSVVGLFGANPWTKAKEMMVEIADTIVEVSKVLKKGTYVGGPTKAWAEGVGLAIGAFSPVYAMLVANKVASIFSKGEIGPDEFKTAINTVADGIISVSNKFAGVDFVMGPTKEWAEGVGTAIGAFSPVYKMLLANNIASLISKGGVGPEEFSLAIQTVSEGIIKSAEIFSKNTASFDEGKYPSEKWGKGVGSALKAFTPVYNMLMKSGFWKGGKKVIDEMKYGISSITNSMIETAKKMGNVRWESYPSSEWIKGLSSSVMGYVNLIKSIEKANVGIGGIFSKDPMVGIAKSMITLAKGYDKLANSLINLSNSMKLLNVDDLKTLVVLTNSIANPEIIISKDSEGGAIQTVNNNITNTTPSANNSMNNAIIEQKLQMMVEILANIQLNTVSLDQVVQLMSEERIKSDEIV